jgi:nitroreductase/NAD-dependent dihydropyrimidine dehydrogenase PreA subunit
MIDFVVNRQSCTRCGLCVTDCPARIIAMSAEDLPVISPEKEAVCYRCQHCLAICPTGAASILGLDPRASQPLVGNTPEPAQLEALIKGRRSVRFYREENLPTELLQHLLEVAWHAPTGINSRQVLFTVVDDRQKLATLREEVMSGLARLVRANALPERLAFFADFVRVWEEKGQDIIFRNAPHLVIATAPEQVASPQQDCLIALTYFELYAQACGVGTVWNGLAKWTINDLLPEYRDRLGIPADHVFGYAMAFGWPAHSYVRTVQHGPAHINRFAG